jgi:hypothetical protein
MQQRKPETEKRKRPGEDPAFFHQRKTRREEP